MAEGFMWWVEKIFHIETLVIIFIVWCVLYVLLKNRDGRSFSERLSSLFNRVLNGEDNTYSGGNAPQIKLRTAASGGSGSSGGGGGGDFSGETDSRGGNFKSDSKKQFKSEERCREIFEGIFKKPFPSVRPDWLKNPQTKQNLELDGFCKDIVTPLGKGLAFEYDGEQHSRFSKRFHSDDPNKFVYQVKKDFYKDKVCKNKGILLIRIPYFISYADLDLFIVQKLNQYKLLNIQK